MVAKKIPVCRNPQFVYFCRLNVRKAEMEKMRSMKVRELLLSKEIGKEVLVKGWVRTKRGNKQVNFIAVNDGSILHNIQVVVEVAAFPEDLLKQITTDRKSTRLNS